MLQQSTCTFPDRCTCPDGYDGFDCQTPLCRHKQTDKTPGKNRIASCLNGGVCIKKDTCQCVQTGSILWKVFQTHRAADGLHVVGRAANHSRKACANGRRLCACRCAAQPTGIFMGRVSTLIICTRRTKSLAVVPLIAPSPYVQGFYDPNATSRLADRAATAATTGAIARHPTTALAPKDGRDMIA